MKQEAENIRGKIAFFTMENRSKIDEAKMLSYCQFRLYFRFGRMETKCFEST